MNEVMTTASHSTWPGYSEDDLLLITPMFEKLEKLCAEKKKLDDAINHKIITIAGIPLQIHIMPGFENRIGLFSILPGENSDKGKISAAFARFNDDINKK